MTDMAQFSWRKGALLMTMILMAGYSMAATGSVSPETKAMDSLRCGAIALHQVAVALQGAKARTAGIDAAPTPLRGFSMADLLELAQSAGLDLTAVVLANNEPLIVPSVAHLKQGHYVAITAQKGDLYWVVDRASGEGRWLDEAAIAAESSGNFLVPADKAPLRWKRLTRTETHRIVGGWLEMPPAWSDPYDGCGNGSGGGSPAGATQWGSAQVYAPLCGTCGGGKGGNSTGGDGASCPTCPQGMAKWEVSEPFINSWIYDEPLGYNPGVGYRISFKLAYKQRESLAGTYTDAFSCGQKWDFSWMTYVLPAGGSQATMIVAGGGQRNYTADGATPEYYTSSLMTQTTTGVALTGYTVQYPNGAIDYYNYVVTNTTGKVLCYRSQQVDPAGHATQFAYTNASGTTKLVSVIDADGLTNTLNYTNTTYPGQITGVTDPFGRTTSLFYNSGGLLTNVTDVAGISSLFSYDTNLWITNLTTPYGTTVFNYTDLNNMTETNVINRAVMVIDAAGGTNLYVYRDYSSFLSTNSCVLPQQPAGAPTLSSNRMTYQNSWHWGPMQFASLSTSNMNSFTAADYMKGRLQNWLDAVSTNAPDALNMMQASSPDGVTQGQQTWYAYNGEFFISGITYKGNDGKPTLAACILPDGNSWYNWMQRNGFGNITNIMDTWSLAFGTAVNTRSNQFFYAANGIDMVQQIGPLGETVAGYSYDGNHNILTVTNAAGDVTTNTYDRESRLTSIKTPAGLTTTNIYFASGLYTNRVQQQIDLQISRTNSYTYTNGLILTQTDERGLMRTNSWDNLQRLTGTAFPDGAISNIYLNLDLVETIDKLGYTNAYGYDALRHLLAVTNAPGNVTRYNYCPCGALESTEDALSNYTIYYYDIAGRLTNTDYADGSSIRKYYDSLSRVTNITDGAGVSVTNWFTDNGLLYASSNAFGQVFAKFFDIEDRLTNTVDGNGVTVTNVYDNVGRLLARGLIGGGVEHFGYTAAGLVFYTNQAEFVTTNGYDAAGRKIAETNANGQVTQYAYSAAGDMMSLSDGKNDTTQWGYDVFGRVTNKVDATGATILRYGYDPDSRLTNRWMMGTNTGYYYDLAGNLTNIVYPQRTNTYAYDALRRLTNMVDSFGTNLLTTAFTWTPTGQPASETSPWASDTISFLYSQGHRTNLSLTQPSGTWNQSYAYDAAWRLQTLTSPAGQFGYGYSSANPASALFTTLSLPNGASISNYYDSLARLDYTALLNYWGHPLDGYNYGYDVRSLRTNITRQLGLTTNNITAGYDAIGELASWTARESSGTPRQNEQLAYGYDAANNLQYRTNGAMVQTFTVNSLNEISNVTRTGPFTETGSTPSPASSVTVNGGAAQTYGDFTFARTNITLNNGNNSFTNIAQNVYGVNATNTFSLNLPTPVNFQYDANGNLTNDGTRVFSYDAENQLTNVFVSNLWQATFLYDGMNRRRIERDYTWQSGVWVQTNEVRYIYDGLLVIQERDTNNAPSVTYTRGLDLSMTLSGAGGIGGMLGRTDTNGSTFYHADGNGNVTALIDANENIVARYEYDAYGRLINKTGPMADANRYRFSSKEVHPNSGLVYYLYRYYDPNLQRWLNRDPLGDYGNVRFVFARYSLTGRQPFPFEKWGDPNLYGFVGNDPILYLDYIGLTWYGNGLAGAASGALAGAASGALVGAGVGAIGGAGIGALPGAGMGAAAGAIAGGIGGFIAGALSGSAASTSTALKNGAFCGALAGIPGGAAAVGGIAAGATAGVISGGISGGASGGWKPTPIIVGAGFGGLVGGLGGMAEGLPPGYAGLVGVDTELGGQVVGGTITLASGNW